MQRTKLVRTITSLTKKHNTLQLNSYCQPNSQEIYSKNRTIDSLINSGHLNSAVETFYKNMHTCDVVTHNLLISGYKKHGFWSKSLSLYKDMVFNGFRENPFSFSIVLSVCSDVGLFIEGVQVHCKVVKLGFSSNLFIGSCLVGMYVNVGLGEVGLKLFDELPERSLGTWNLLLKGFCEFGRLDELLGLYGRMKMDGVEANGVSYSYLLRGCGVGRFVDEGRQLHCVVVKSGWAESNLFVANALVDLYSDCGSLVDAVRLFEVISEEDVISWNSIISVYAAHGFAFDAIELFSRMQCWGKRPSVRSIVGLLNLASRIESYQLGKQVHGCTQKSGLFYGSVYIQSALIDMYGKCGDIKSSVSVYESLPEKTLECCNSLMTSFLSCSIMEDVVEMFGLMVDEGIVFDEITLSLALKALSASALAGFNSCCLLHCCAIKSGFESDVAVSSALIDAYSRSGYPELSCRVFKKIVSPNVTCYTTLINGYARNGKGKECLQIFQQMIQNGLSPDKVTFLCLLTGCNHAGLVHEGKMLFSWMRTAHGFYPDQQHYSCMVDLLGRAGLLDEAEELMMQAPEKNNSIMWGSLLRSCTVYKNKTLGRKAAEVLMELKPEDPAICLQASNFYSEIGDFETSIHIRDITLAKKATKDIGYSSIQLNDRF